MSHDAASEGFDLPAVEAVAEALVLMSPADMVPALAAGQIAGYIVAEPFNAAAENLQSGARTGMESQLYWPDVGWVRPDELVLRRHREDLA